MAVILWALGVLKQDIKHNEQLYDCRRISDLTLKDVGKFTRYQNKTK